ncbi:MAG: hypothetical protein ABI977_31260, partial [Acidobacteriota bacterium]
VVIPTSYKACQVCRHALNEVVSELSGQARNDLSITEAQSLLPEKMRDEIRLRARNQAWERLVPEEVFDRTPLPEAVRISEAISHLQEHLQDRASIARRVRNDFVEEKIHPSEKQLKDHPAALTTTVEDRKQFVQIALDSLSQTDTRRMLELDRYATQTREDVYRGFELLDELRRKLELKRAEQQSHPQEVALWRDIPIPASAELKAAGRLRIEAAVAPEFSKTTITDEQNHRGEIHSSRALSSFQTQHVNSDHEWQYDSLQESLTPEMSQYQVEVRDREDWQHQR